MIAEKDQLLARVGIDKADAAQRPRKSLARFGLGRLSDLTAAHTAAGDFRVGSKAQETQVVFGPRDKEHSGPGDPRQSREIHGNAVEQIKRAGFENERGPPQHVVGTCGAYFDVHRRWTAQIELRVQFDSGFGQAELGPRKKLQR